MASASSYYNGSNISRTQARRAVHGMQRAALDQASGQGPGDELHLGQLGLQQGELRRGFARVGHDDLGTAAHTPARHGQAGGAQAQHQHALVGQRRQALAGAGGGCGGR